MRYFLLILALCASPIAANAITTTLEYEDQREIASTNAVWKSVLAALSSATNSTLSIAQASITSATNSVLESARAADTALSNTLARAIADARPADYATVSNAAMSAVQTETDPTVPLWAKTSQKPSYTASEVGALGTSGEQWISGNPPQEIRFGFDADMPKIDFVDYRRRLASLLQNPNQSASYNYFCLPSYSGTLALTSDIDSSTNGLLRVESDPTVAAATNALWSATTAAIANIDIPDIPSYSETNTTANIVYHYGCETVAIPANGTLTGSTSNWPQGAQTFIVLNPAGAYTVNTNALEYSGYGIWPTNTALCVAWRYGSKIYVNPIKLLED